MKQTQLIIALLSLVVMIAFAGCSKDSNPPISPQATESEVLQRMVTSMDSIAEFSSSDEATIDDEGTQEPDYDLISKITAPVSPVRWGRHIFWDQIVRNYTVVKIGDTVAVVTVTKTIPGEFWVGIRFTDTIRVDSILKKPFTETVVRKIRFRRVAHFEEHERNWVPVAMTLAVGKTNSINNFSIASLEISGKIDTTITNPLDTWFRFGRYHGCIPVLFTGDSLKVRVTLNSSDDSSEVVVLRHGIAGGWHERGRVRMPLVSVSGSSGGYVRVYEKTFRTGLPLGIWSARFNATVDVISHGSIYDDSAAFSNEFWGAPYIVIRAQE